MKKIQFFNRGLLTCILVLTAASWASAQTEKLAFSPHWIPQSQFAGYYVALDQGFYKEAGLDVQIIHPSASASIFLQVEKRILFPLS